MHTICQSYSRLTLLFTYSAVISQSLSAKGLSRRAILQRSAFGVLAPVESILNKSLTANAACLPGDLSPSCIGVYKVPIDDNILPFIGTETALKKNAPDLSYVPPIVAPKSVSDALETLRKQRLLADEIVQIVTAGRLEEAGIKVLELLPKVTMAGRLIVNARLDIQGASDAIQELQQQQLQNSFDQVYVSWNSVDVLIGQGLRGEMGASVVAQLTILAELKDATRALDDLIAATRH